MVKYIDLKIGPMENGPWKIETFTVSEEQAKLENMRAIFSFSGGPRIRPGEYTRLLRNGHIWMSDTPGEVNSHRVMIRACRHAPPNSSALIHGLGLGLVLQGALEATNISSVDVVEIDQDLIDMVGPFYREMAEKNNAQLNIINGDALTYKFPVNKQWNYVWHDIWQNICEDDKPEITRLKRRYGKRCDWQGAWPDYYKKGR